MTIQIISNSKFVLLLYFIFKFSKVLASKIKPLEKKSY